MHSSFTDISSNNDIRIFITESAVMTRFHHQNVLGLFGVCFDSPDGTPLMVLPFMVNGNLKSYLVKSRNPLSEKPDIFPVVSLASKYIIQDL